mmetsp:Transcript_21393/g.46628  ORF Transcript_21393/g.46628 Transcript_21393/m.46628 type:complete len:105 (-) Transcript_21393:701-1015(-)
MYLNGRGSTLDMVSTVPVHVRLEVPTPEGFKAVADLNRVIVRQDDNQSKLGRNQPSRNSFSDSSRSATTARLGYLLMSKTFVLHSQDQVDLRDPRRSATSCRSR